MALYSFTVDPGQSEKLPNTCAYGYVKNTDDTQNAAFILYGEGMSTLSKTLSPGQTLNFSNFYVYKILNNGPGVIEIAFSPDQFSVSESVAAVSITGTADINITNSTLTVEGTVSIGNAITVTGITNTVNVAGNVTATISNSTLNVSGTVNIGNNITIGSVLGTVAVSGSVDANITNSTVNVSGTVSIGNNITIGGISAGVTIPVSGSVTADISNSTLNVSGTVNIGNNITIGAVTGGVTFDVSGSSNITVNDVGLIVTTNNNNGTTATLSSANTAQQFTATSPTLCQHFQVRNNSTETVYIGSSGAQSIPLFPQGVFLWDANPNEQTDLSTWYFVGATAGDEIILNWQA